MKHATRGAGAKACMPMRGDTKGTAPGSAPAGIVCARAPGCGAKPRPGAPGKTGVTGTPGVNIPGRPEPRRTVLHATRSEGEAA